MLNILTFNLGLLTLQLFGHAFIQPTPYLLERLSAMPKAFIETNADIIALQEIYDIKDRQFLISKLKAIYPYAAYCNKKNPFRIKDNGLLFFSKHPITSSEIVIFKDAPTDEKLFIQKGILASSVIIENFGELVFYNLHITAGGVFYKPEDNNTKKIQESQINQVLELANKFNNKLSIILGDMNVGPEVSKNIYDLFIKNGYVDTFTQFCQKNNDYKKITWDPLNPLNIDGSYKDSPPQRIDHIFISKKNREIMNIIDAKVIFDKPIVRISNDKYITLSDHYGLLVSLKKIN